MRTVASNFLPDVYHSQLVHIRTYNMNIPQRTKILRKSFAAHKVENMNKNLPVFVETDGVILWWVGCCERSITTVATSLSPLLTGVDVDWDGLWIADGASDFLAVLLSVSTSDSSRLAQSFS